MIALDTNIVLRLLLNDDPPQVERLLAALRGRTAMIQDTVILELEWVLRSLYRFAAGDVAHALQRLAGNTEIVLENPARLQSALRGYDAGLDFTDAYHLAGAAECAGFLTFDRELLERGPRAFERPLLLEP